MSPSLVKRWRKGNFDKILPTVVLNPELSKVVHLPLVRRDGCLLLRGAAAKSRITRSPYRTMYEFIANRFHVEDFVDLPKGKSVRALNSLTLQGAKAAMELAERLKSKDDCRVFLQFAFGPARRLPSGALVADATQRANDKFFCAFLTFYKRRSKPRFPGADKYADDVMTIDT